MTIRNPTRSICSFSLTDSQNFIWVRILLRGPLEFEKMSTNEPCMYTIAQIYKTTLSDWHVRIFHILLLFKKKIYFFPFFGCTLDFIWQLLPWSAFGFESRISYTLNVCGVSCSSFINTLNRIATAELSISLSFSVI